MDFRVPHEGPREGPRARKVSSRDHFDSFHGCSLADHFRTLTGMR